MGHSRRPGAARGSGVRSLGAQRSRGPDGRRLHRLGRARRLADALAGRQRGVGAVRPRDRGRRAVQVPDPRARRGVAGQSRSAGPVHRDAAANRVGGHRVAVRVEGRGLAGPARPGAAPQGTGEHLRGAPGLVAAGTVLCGACRPAHRLRGGAGLHARGVHAGDGAPVRRLLGVPGHRVLRAQCPLRRPGRAAVPHRQAAPGRRRRHPRLGTGALPPRRMGARALRRYPAVRTRTPVAWRAPRLGYLRLRLRPARGSQLPRRQRALLVRRVPRRRAAGRRGRVDAVPRLLPQGGPVGAEPVRRPGEPRRDQLPAGDERHRLQAPHRCTGWASASSGTWAG